MGIDSDGLMGDDRLVFGIHHTSRRRITKFDSAARGKMRANGTILVLVFIISIFVLVLNRR